jgi:hypothetical protein
MYSQGTETNSACAGLFGAMAAEFHLRGDAAPALKAVLADPRKWKAGNGLLEPVADSTHKSSSYLDPLSWRLARA